MKKIPESIWKEQRNKTFLVFLSIISIFIVVIGTGMGLFFSGLLKPTDNLRSPQFIIGAILNFSGLITALIIMSFEKGSGKYRVLDLTNMRKSRDSNYYEETIGIAKGIDPKQALYSSDSILSFGYWRRRIAMGILADTAVKETLGVLLEISRHDENQKAVAFAARCLEIAAIKLNQINRINLERALLDEKLETIEDKIFYQAAYSLWEKRFPKRRLIIAYIVSCLILPPFGIVMMAIFIPLMKKFKKLMHEENESELIKIIQTKRQVQKLYAAIVLGDIGSEVSLPVLKELLVTFKESEQRRFIVEAYNLIAKKYKRETLTIQHPADIAYQMLMSKKTDV